MLWPTVLLVGTATILMIVIGLYMGIRGGWSRGSRIDNGSMGLSLAFYSMPDFWLAMMLLVVSRRRWDGSRRVGTRRPNGDLTGMAHLVDVANHMVLPVVTLTLGYVGEYYLVMRSSLLDVMGEDYLTAVRAKGMREGKVLWRHAVRNPMFPTISVIAFSLGFVIVGEIVVEVVFSYPGLGPSRSRRSTRRTPDPPGPFLFFTLAMLVSNLIADLLYSCFDPR